MARWFIALVFFIVSGVTQASAQDYSPEVERSAHEIFGDVLSPFCPGRSLNDCPSGQASELKNQIRASLAGGTAKNVIMQQLYEQYGEKIRAVPTTEGFGKAVWLGPIAFLFVGGVIIIIWMMMKRGDSPELTQSSAPLSADMEKRIAEELNH